jgi:hypothetical protein
MHSVIAAANLVSEVSRFLSLSLSLSLSHAHTHTHTRSAHRHTQLKSEGKQDFFSKKEKKKKKEGKKKAPYLNIPESVLWTHPQQQKGQLSDNKELESFENQSSL